MEWDIKPLTIKCCPFCGSSVRIRRGVGHITYFYCSNETGCGAIVSFQGGPDIAEAPDPLKNWNCRVEQ